MNGTGVFAIEILASLAISTAIVLKLRGLLRRIGAETCTRPGNTEFWVAYAVLLAFFSRAGSVPALNETAQAQSSVLVVLIGQLIGLALIGRVVWNAVLGARDEVVASEAAARRGGR